MINWFYQWYDAERSRVSLDDLAAQQTALFLDGYIASTSSDDDGGKRMRYAETGFNLEVDLTRGNIERVPTDPQLTELHLGGLGTNARMIWDRVGPEVEPFTPENLLVFGTGLLAGTPAPGCNRTIVSTISPQTSLFAFSMMGGFWGPELKHAGYDKVVIRGKSPELVYLWIHDDKVEIRDASHFGVWVPWRPRSSFARS